MSHDLIIFLSGIGVGVGAGGVAFILYTFGHLNYLFRLIDANEEFYVRNEKRGGRVK
jgi:hypothetical protein